jgi:cytochrome c-type biogenesis protein
MDLLLSVLAGSLTVLSPCVLPVLPFVTASSLRSHKWGPLALALGLLISFVGASILISSTGFLLGFSAETMKIIAGVLMTLSGLLFVSQKLADGFASKLSVLSNIHVSENQNHSELVTEFINGLILGIVWTPCSGPSLGVALGLAAKSDSVGQASLRLGLYGVGAVLPLLLFSYGAKSLLKNVRKNSQMISNIKKIFGILIMGFGVAIVTGYDRNIESFLTGIMPDSFLSFITRF